MQSLLLLDHRAARDRHEDSDITWVRQKKKDFDALRKAIQNYLDFIQPYRETYDFNPAIPVNAIQGFNVTHFVVEKVKETSDKERKINNIIDKHKQKIDCLQQKLQNADKPEGGYYHGYIDELAEHLVEWEIQHALRIGAPSTHKAFYLSPNLEQYERLSGLASQTLESKREDFSLETCGIDSHYRDLL